MISPQVRLAAELQFCTIDEVFAAGLDDYVDQVQIKLNNIGEALFNAYFFKAFRTGDEEHFVQQEEQQQPHSRKSHP